MNTHKTPIEQLDTCKHCGMWKSKHSHVASKCFDSSKTFEPKKGKRTQWFNKTKDMKLSNKMKNLKLEIRREVGDDWEVLKEAQVNKRNIKSYQKQARRLIENGFSQVHVVALTPDNPTFQEFYYSDGTIFKAF